MRQRCSVKIGDLIKIRRPSIGVPKNTIGMIMDIAFADSGLRYFNIQMFGLAWNHPRRYLGRDLEVISEGQKQKRK